MTMNVVRVVVLRVEDPGDSWEGKGFCGSWRVGGGW
jgi:hypothetical protein